VRSERTLRAIAALTGRSGGRFGSINGHYDDRMGGVGTALVAACAFGTADFLGGLAARRSSAFVATLVGQVAGLAVLAPLLLLAPAPPSAAGLAWGALAGIGGCLGLIVFFRALASGVMSTAAPVTAVVSAGLPVLAGLLLGERPALQAWIGVGAGLIAVGVISAPAEGRGRVGGGRQALPLALAAGAGFGLFFICLSRAPAATGFWPLLGARLSSLALLTAALLARRATWRAAPGAAGLAALSGALDMTANALFVLALRRGELALVAVLVALYPAATVLLASGVLRERLRRVQLAGVGLALAAVSLIASGTG
jgi:drug/metabolite transporter (DMT)-like permease